MMGDTTKRNPPPPHDGNRGFKAMKMAENVGLDYLDLSRNRISTLIVFQCDDSIGGDHKRSHTSRGARRNKVGECTYHP